MLSASDACQPDDGRSESAPEEVQRAAEAKDDYKEMVLRQSNEQVNVYGGSGNTYSANLEEWTATRNPGRG